MGKKVLSLKIKHQARLSLMALKANAAALNCMLVKLFDYDLSSVWIIASSTWTMRSIDMQLF